MNTPTVSSAATGLTSAPAVTPLEIHPSVDPELARGLIAACEYIADHREEFCMNYSEFHEDKGCVICHAERLSGWRRPFDWDGMFARMTGGVDPYLGDFDKIRLGFPLGHWLRIFSPFLWPDAEGIQAVKAQTWGTDAGLFARVNHFLATGE